MLCSGYLCSLQWLLMFFAVVTCVLCSDYLCSLQWLDIVLWFWKIFSAFCLFGELPSACITSSCRMRSKSVSQLPLHLPASDNFYRCRFASHRFIWHTKVGNSKQFLAEKRVQPCIAVYGNRSYARLRGNIIKSLRRFVYKCTRKNSYVEKCGQCDGSTMPAWNKLFMQTAAKNLAFPFSDK